jgi:hypothetical protein
MFMMRVLTQCRIIPIVFSCWFPMILNIKRIPTGFRPKAQGCDAGATLGIESNIFTNPNAGCAFFSS